MEGRNKSIGNMVNWPHSLKLVAKADRSIAGLMYRASGSNAVDISGHAR